MRNLPDSSIPGCQNESKIAVAYVVSDTGFCLVDENAAMNPQLYSLASLLSYTIEHKNLPETRRFFRIPAP
jgi:hypothetical protein